MKKETNRSTVHEQLVQLNRLYEYLIEAFEEVQVTSDKLLGKYSDEHLDKQLMQRQKRCKRHSFRNRTSDKKPNKYP